MTFRLAGSGWMVGVACALVLTGAGTALLGCSEKAPAEEATSTSGTGGAASSGVGGAGGASVTSASTTAGTGGAGGMGSATSSVATGAGGAGGGGMPLALSFAAAVNYDSGPNPYSVTAGDWNGDGKLDLVTANGGSINVSILLGNGNGTFQPKVDYAAGVGPISVTAGDWNGDGKPDLAVANGDSNVSILLNTSQ